MLLTLLCACLLPATAAAPPRWAPVPGPWDGAEGPVVGVATADGPWIAWQRGGTVRARPARGGEDVTLPVEKPTRDAWPMAEGGFGPGLAWGSLAGIALLGRADGQWRSVLVPAPGGTVRDVSLIAGKVVLAWVDDTGTPHVDTVPAPFGDAAETPAAPAEPLRTDLAPVVPGARPTPGEAGVAWVIPDGTGAVLAWSEVGAPEPVLRGSAALRAGRAFVVGRDLWLPWADSDGWHVVRQSPPKR